MVCFYILFGIWNGLIKGFRKMSQCDEREGAGYKPQADVQIEVNGWQSTPDNFYDLGGFKSFSERNNTILANIKLGIADIILIWIHQPQNSAKNHLCV